MYRSEKKLPAGLFAILLGGFGIHKFYLGYIGAGVIQILLNCFFGAGHIIGIIEGIIYLTKSDDEFDAIYVRGRREWL
jgi:TM2 domain-containing membrane protein YozV